MNRSSTFSVRFLALSLFAVGCASDNELAKKNDEKSFDTGEVVDNPDTDTDEQEETGETAEVVPDACEDEYWPYEAIAQLAECFAEETTVGTFTPQVLWDKQSFSTSSSSAECMMQPIVCSLTDDDGDGDADDDDTPDVLIITYSSNVVRALSGDDGSEIWSATGNGTIQGQGGLACGDIDNDGFVEVIAAASAGVEVFDHEGNLEWASNDCSGHLDGTSDAPGIADMNGDGDPEVLIGNCILDNAGNLEGAGDHGWGSSGNVGSGAFAVDVDQDGDLELVAGNALYEMDGTTIWYNGEADGYPAVANFDSDNYGEFAVTGDARMRVQDDDGTVLCEATIPSASGSYGGPPTIADFDGDGEAEIGVAANSTYTVFEADCSVLWQNTATTDPSSGNTGSSVFDFEGDGIADVVYADEHWVWVMDGRDGSMKMQDAYHSNNTWLEYPSIADINADGSADIAVCNTGGSWGSYKGVTIFEDADHSWRPGRRIWNQHGYNITNVNEDGSIPEVPETNWLSYNNFRSGDLTPGQGYSGPDLFAKIRSVCTDECDEGNVTVWLQLGNQGYNDTVDPIAVEIWGVTGAGPELLHTFNWNAALPQAYLSESYAVELTGVPTPLYDLIVKIDGGEDNRLGVVDECHEDNNVTKWGEFVCP